MKHLTFLFAVLLLSTPVISTDVSAQVFELKTSDGKKDHFVWKPLSDTKRARSGKYKGKIIPVTLFPRKGPQKQNWAAPFVFRSVELQKDAKRIARGTFVYHWPEDKRPQRQVIRFEIPSRYLPKGIAVVAKDKQGRTFLWPIPDPTKRYD